MTVSAKNRFEDFASVNCDACGNEHIGSNLHSIKLSGFKSILRICDECKSKNSHDQYKTAANILKDIANVVGASDSPEERLSKIKELLEG